MFQKEFGCFSLALKLYSIDPKNFKLINNSGLLVLASLEQASCR